MENRIGENQPTDEDLAKLIEDAKSVYDRMRLFGIILTKDERKELIAARRNSDPMVQKVHDLAVKYKVEIPGMSVGSMIRDLALKNRVAPLTTLLEGSLALSKDTESLAVHEMWMSFLAYYNVLCSMSTRVSELTVELQPIIDFMATGKKQPK